LRGGGGRGGRDGSRRRRGRLPAGLDRLGLRRLGLGHARGPLLRRVRPPHIVGGRVELRVAAVVLDPRLGAEPNPPGDDRRHEQTLAAPRRVALRDLGVPDQRDLDALPVVLRRPEPHDGPARGQRRLIELNADGALECDDRLAARIPGGGGVGVDLELFAGFVELRERNGRRGGVCGERETSDGDAAKPHSTDSFHRCPTQSQRPGIGRHNRKGRAGRQFGQPQAQVLAPCDASIESIRRRRTRLCTDRC
jgi:hypothetical protein